MALVYYKYTAQIPEMQAFRYKKVRHPHWRPHMRMERSKNSRHPHQLPPVRMKYRRNWVYLSLLLFIVDKDAHSA